MFVTIAICVFSSAICSAAIPNLEVASKERDLNYVGTEIADAFGVLLSDEELLTNRGIYKVISYTTDRDDYTTKRKKRAASLLAKGALAVRAILRGAKPVYSNGKVNRNFEKKGDYVTAIKDFLSVSPVNIRERTSESGVKVMTGLVGDRILVLRRHQKHLPVLDIKDTTGQYLEPGQQFIDRIIYKKEIN